MTARSKIEWTDRTWNPVTGCTKVSPGCDHCYAENIARRFAGAAAFPHGFDLTLRPERLADPLRWTKPARVFVNSMSDLFHDDVPDEFIADVFAIMSAGFHTYQVLTKRHGRMRSLLSSAEFLATVERRRTQSGRWTISGELLWPLPNVWIGVSVEDQKRAELRVPALLETPAAVRFISAEPLLGEVDLSELAFCTCGRTRWVDDENWSPEHPGEWDGVRTMGDGRIPCGFCNHGGWHVDDVVRPGLDWVIVGGESGSASRWMDPDWARTLRDQCVSAGVAFFFKQWGGRNPKKGGRELDGRTWDEFPVGEP